MSRELVLKIFAPLAVSASIFGAAFVMSSAPPAATAQPLATPIGAPIPAPTLSGGVPSLAPMLKETMPAVVNISVTSKIDVSSQLGPLMDDPFFRRFFGVPDQPQEQEQQSIGSGVIVDAARGYVITNNHVIDQADTIKVRLSDDREFDAKLIGKDPDTDIAVLQIKADNLRALQLADSDKLQVGDFVVAIGSPFGLRQTVTSGIVSALGRSGIGGGYEDFIQTDASINPGNSGGALVNLRGELIGINSMILSRTGGNIGIGFAIPANLARGIMTQLVEHGSVERGLIGINGQDLTGELAKALGVAPGTRGAVVTRVLPKSPAEKAGVQVEDVIVEANGHAIDSFVQLRNLVGLLRIGEKVELKVLRDGKPRTLSVTIGKDSELATKAEGLHPALKGATFAPLGEKGGDTGGVLVQAVEPRSPAARAGLRNGDVIVGVNRQPVADIETFRRLAGGKGSLLLNLRRGEGALFLLIQ
jgi:Do/DeqQ family serine protease